MKSYLQLIGGCRKIMAEIQTHQYFGTVCSQDDNLSFEVSIY
jgi:hypothetical protein